MLLNYTLNFSYNGINERFAVLGHEGDYKYTKSNNIQFEPVKPSTGWDACSR